MWTVAAPLLRKYNLTAILFAIPGRISDAPGVRPTIEDDCRAEALRHEGSKTEVLRREEVLRQDSGQQTTPASALHPGPPFATWPELRAMHDSGVVDIQSHTRSHAMIFGHHTVAGFVTPDYEREPMLNRPLTSEAESEFLGPDALGIPLYLPRSRMSDARRFLPDPSTAERCRAHVARLGGRDFFRPSRMARRARSRSLVLAAAVSKMMPRGSLSSARNWPRDVRC